MKGSSQSGIPACWKHRKRRYEKKTLNLMKEINVFQTPKGCTIGPLWVKSLEFQFSKMKIKIKEKYNLTGSQYSAIIKVALIDGAPGHSDAITKGRTDVRKFWSEKKLKKWKEVFLPANSSEKTQFGDLGVNKEIQKFSKQASEDYITQDPLPLTPLKHLQLPGQQLRLKWYTNWFSKLSLETCKLAWMRTAIPFEKGIAMKRLWRSEKNS